LIWNFGERNGKGVSDLGAAFLTDYSLCPMDNKCRLFIACKIRVRC